MRTSFQRLLVRPTTIQTLGAVVELLGCPRIFPAGLASEAGLIGIWTSGRRHKHDLALVIRDQGYTGLCTHSTSRSKTIDGSPEIKEGVNGTGAWRSRLKTFKQYQYESDLGDTSNQGARLVDDPSYGADFDLWQELIRFRRRRKDTKGGDVIWEEIQKRNLQLSTEGRPADRAWDGFVRLGDWENLVAYAQWIREGTGKTWQGLYFRILSHCLTTKPNHAHRWHKRLFAEFPPSFRQLRYLFNLAVSSKGALTAFKAIYMDLPNCITYRNMYRTIIPRLCGAEKYGMAVEWHHLMMSMNDIPSTSISVNPLLHYLAIHGRHRQFMDIINGMVRAGVSFEDSDDHLRAHKAWISSEIVNRELGESRGIAPKVLSDGFCARLFATTTFSIDTIINGLRAIGTNTIGPLSLRELALRERSSTILCHRRIVQLKDAGITLGDSTFSTLVVSLASNNEGELLQEVVNCDMHPDAFEDKDLQLSLLDSYHRNGDRLRVDRSLAIITVKMSPEIHWNVLLRSSLKRQDTARFYQILDTMQENQMLVSAKSSTYIGIHMLSTRQRSRRPVRTDDVRKVVGIFQRILRARGAVSPWEWKEILRRLGMMGRLVEFEKVSIWLMDWYSNPKAQASELNRFNQKRHHARVSQLSRFNQKKHRARGLVSAQHAQHPLRAIFSAPLQHAIVAWGFQHASHVETGLTWRWGLELLRKLKRRNVLVQRDTIRRACRLRLIALFGHGRSNRKINRLAQSLNEHSIEYYGREIEAICGRDIFCVNPCLPRGHPGRNLRLKEWVMGK